MTGADDRGRSIRDALAEYERFADLNSRGTRTEMTLRAMNTVLQRSRSLLRLVVREEGVSLATFDTLHALVALRGNAALPSELAENLGVSRAAVTARVRQLEADGLVQRQDNDRDRRSQVLSATAAGVKLWDTLAARWSALEVGLLDGLTDSQLQNLTELLVGVVDAPRTRASSV